MKQLVKKCSKYSLQKTSIVRNENLLRVCSTLTQATVSSLANYNRLPNRISPKAASSNNKIRVSDHEFCGQ
jgi:hypothetical protein